MAMGELTGTNTKFTEGYWARFILSGAYPYKIQKGQINYWLSLCLFWSADILENSSSVNFHGPRLRNCSMRFSSDNFANMPLVIALLFEGVNFFLYMSTRLAISIARTSPSPFFLASSKTSRTASSRRCCPLAALSFINRLMSNIRLRFPTTGILSTKSDALSI